MTGEESNLRLADKHLKAWLKSRRLPEDDHTLDELILDHLRRRRDVAKRNADRASKRR